MNQPLVSVIVTTKNEEKNIARFLHAIKQQTYKPLEIIVVDNNSKDQTVAISKLFTKNIYQHGPERSAQRNFGAAKAKGAYLFFLDADMELRPEAIASSVASADKDCQAVIVKEIFIGRGFWSKCKALEKTSYSDSGEAEAARFYTRKLFLQLNGYDEQLTGPEDMDMHHRAAAFTSFARTGIILHYDEHISYVQFLKKRYYYSLSLRRYFTKNPKAQQQEFHFIRKAYLKNWKLFLKHPILALGFFVLRIGESCVVLCALCKI